MVKNLKQLFDKLYTIKPVNDYLHPVLVALDDAFFGCGKSVSAAPYLTDNLDVKRFMTFVIMGLTPAALASICFYGIRAILMILVSYVAGGAVEVIFAMIRKKEIHEGFLVTGLIYPLTLPPNTPLWIVAVGVIFGTFIGKEIFGGTGKNVFNPALVGRLFITIAFPEVMSTAYLVPFTDTVTSATPLLAYKSSQTVAPVMQMLLGITPGSLGETFRLGLMAGGVFLLVTRVSSWRVVIPYLVSVAVFAFLGHAVAPVRIAPPVFQLLSGGLMLGAFFMASDPVTSPFTRAGKYIFGTLCGLLTVLIRGFSGYMEGVMFSIVILNGFTPLIDVIVLKIKYRKK